MRKPQCQWCAKYYGWISFSSNIFNAVFKGGIGFLTGSQALIADGFHSLSDSLTAIVTIATLKVSEKPSDESHPYGHGKIEFISSAFFGLLLMVIAFILTIKAISSIVTHTVSAPNLLAPWPALVSILVNKAISSYGLCVGTEINSPVIVANAKENKADAASSVASLAGIVGALLGFPFLDPVAAILVAVLIAHMGYEIFHEAATGLMDGSVKQADQRRIQRLARSIAGVERVAFLKTRRIGQKTWADVGVAVSPTLSLKQADRIVNEVRNALMRKFEELQDAVVYLNTHEPVAPEKPTFWKRFAARFRRRDAIG